MELAGDNFTADGTSSVLRQLTSSVNFKEQRKTARFEAVLRASYWLGNGPKQELIGITKDLSVGGCLLIATRDAPIETPVKMEIYLDDNNSNTMYATGRIVRMHAKGSALTEYGIEFDELSNQNQKTFEKYCFEKMYKMVGLKEWPTRRNNG